MTKEELMKWLEAEIEKSKKELDEYLPTDFVSFEEECRHRGWVLGRQHALEECLRNIKTMESIKYEKVCEALITASVFGAEHHFIKDGIEKIEWCIHIPDADDKMKFVTLYVTGEQYEAFRELLEERK